VGSVQAAVAPETRVSRSVVGHGRMFLALKIQSRISTVTDAAKNLGD
jgi:hypothetical protein